MIISKNSPISLIASYLGADNTLNLGVTAWFHVSGPRSSLNSPSFFFFFQSLNTCNIL